MKKLILLMAIVFIASFTLTACEDQDAFTLYTNMALAMDSVTSSQTKAVANVSIETADEKVDMNMVMDMKQIIHSETDVEMELFMNIDMGELGGMDATMFFKDGVMYYDMMDMKLKMELPLDTAMQLAGGLSIDTAGLIIKEAIASSEVKDVGGDKQISFSLNGEMLSDVLSGMMGQMLSQVGADGAEMTFGDVSYTALIGPDNLPKEEHIVFSMDMTVMGETATAAFDMLMTTTDYNNVKSIAYPSDLDEYQDMAA